MDIWCIEDQVLPEENKLKYCSSKSLVLAFASKHLLR